MSFFTRTIVAAFLGLAVSHTAPATEPPITTPPNVLIIYVDDLGFGDLGSFGHHTLETPNLDKLASEGMRLTAYYAPSPLCSPSRAALLTGRTPFRTGIESWIPEDTEVQLGPKEITLATLLKLRGYETFLGGKWHLNGSLSNQKHTQPEDHGFDHWLALHAFPIPHNENPTNFYRNGKPLGEVEGFTADIVMDEAIRWLSGRKNSAAPFFMYVAMIEPHSTIANPDAFNAKYAQFTRGRPDPIESGQSEPPTNLAARGPGEYYANISYLDHQLGRLLDHLDEEGLSDSTFVFFASDNGPVTTDWRHWYEINLYGSTGGLRGRKADLYEGGIRVPAIVRYPGVVKAGSESDSPISGYDVLPTLASLVGVDVPSDRPIDGEDVSAVLRGEPFGRARPLYWEFNDDQGFRFALRDRHWKLLADADLKRLKLFNLETDPFEVQDLAAREPDRVESLLAALKEFRDSVASDPLRPSVDVR